MPCVLWFANCCHGEVQERAVGAVSKQVMNTGLPVYQTQLIALPFSSNTKF